MPKSRIEQTQTNFAFFVHTYIFLLITAALSGYEICMYRHADADEHDPVVQPNSGLAFNFKGKTRQTRGEDIKHQSPSRPFEKNWSGPFRAEPMSSQIGTLTLLQTRVLVVLSTPHSESWFLYT